MSSSGSSRRCREIPISSTRSSTAPSSRSTGTAPAQGGDSKSRRHDSVGTEPLLHGISIEALIGDKPFDSEWLRAQLNERGALAVIPPNGSRAATIPYDKEMYKWRHLIENLFQKITELRRIATRYDCP